MKNKLGCIALLFLFSVTVFAQTEFTTVSVPHIDTPYNSSDAVNSLTEHFSMGTTYTNNFFLPQVGLARLKIVYPAKQITTSLSTSFYGYSEYYRIRGALGFSHYFRPYIAIGLEGFFSGFKFSGGTRFKATGGLNVSLLAFPTKKLVLGFLVENTSFSFIRANGIKYRLPTIFYLGFSYCFTQNIILAVEGAKDLTNPFLIRLDFEYRPIRQFILKCGISYQTSASANFGFGLRLKKFILDATVKYNVRVSWGCQVGIGVQLSENKHKSEKHTY
ncbi:MAG: hypothetical protein MJ010_00300 [Paludibacteraceae bacterium]|nr:hypothetical protein [Paludibacteraceae bacterium]